MAVTRGSQRSEGVQPSSPEVARSRRTRLSTSTKKNEEETQQDQYESDSQEITTSSTPVRSSTSKKLVYPQEPCRFPIGVFLLSLLAFPVCYILNLTSAMDDSRLVFLAGVIICFSVAPLTYLGVVRGVPAGRDIYFYVFTIFSFTALVDFILALTIDGWVDWMKFYCREGEVYLTTAHGLWINVWDGTFHFSCYLIMTGLMLRKSHSYSDPRFRTVALVWAGSILNSMIVLFAGSAVGLHARHIKPSYLLNIPYALFPGIFLWRVVQARSNSNASGIVGKEVNAKKPSWAWFIDVPLLVAIFASVCLCIFRCLVVLRSELPLALTYAKHTEAHLLDTAAYPQVQMVNYAYFFLPYLVWALVKVWEGFSTQNNVDGAFIDATKFFLGFLLQGTFSYVGAALHEGRAYLSKVHQGQSVETGTLTWFILANGLLVAVPAAILLRANLKEVRNGQVQVEQKKQ